MLYLAAVLHLYSVKHNGMNLTKTVMRYLAAAAAPSVTCPYQTAVCHYVWTVVTGDILHVHLNTSHNHGAAAVGGVHSRD